MKAIVNNAAVPEIMHHLAGVTFVQSVESPALAMVSFVCLRESRLGVMLLASNPHRVSDLWPAGRALAAARPASDSDSHETSVSCHH